MASLGLIVGLTRREIRNRFNGTLSGGLWALLQPLLQLAIYSFVFVRIFNARVPEGSSIATCRILRLRYGRGPRFRKRSCVHRS
jgi:ABC-type polysaccharide/polyol phosphate export permease